MKIAPVSGDLLVQLALGALVIGGAWWVLRGARQQLAAATEQVGAAAEWAANVAQTSLNPASDQNLIYRGTTAVVQTVTDSPDSLGTWLHRTFSGDDERVAAMFSTPIYRGAGATGGW